ncbi:ATP-binding protein [Acidianus sp. HS-5]|uniref:ATP-binding protein n=1 Tax=Acidianus sp. HS-5 TaxID=2886040 RepID=UPI001F191CB8|nr:ATP-binding protein [Acidianus sp. HS-5]BDC17219.1 hypothetical protein HS5_01090 [Acidianus sp. HS-5]
MTITIDFFTDKERSDPSLLFNRETEIKEGLNYLLNEGFLLIEGLRRTGKSSLALSLAKITSVKTLAERYGVPSFYYPIIISLEGVNSTEELVNTIINSIISNYSWALLNNSTITDEVKKLINSVKELLSSYKGYQFNLNTPLLGGGIGKNEGKVFIPLNFRSLLDFLYNFNVLVIFDEFQIINRWKDKESFIEDLKYAYDKLYKKVKIVVTGSVTYLKNYFSTEYKDVFHGREINGIWLDNFPINKAEEYLRLGLKFYSVNVDEYVIKSGVYNTFGNPAWLNYFGKYYVKTRDLQESLLKSYENMGSEAKKGLTSIRRVRKSEAYVNIVKILLQKGELTCYEISKNINLKIESCQKIAKTLESLGVIEKNNGKYSIRDPAYFSLFQPTFTELSCPKGDGGKLLLNDLAKLKYNSVELSCGHELLIKI